MSDIKLYSGTFCPFCKKVEQVIKDNSLFDKVPIVNIDTSDQAREELLAGGGKSQIPCLYHDGQWLYESKDIIKYIEDNFLL